MEECNNLGMDGTKEGNASDYVYWQWTSHSNSTPTAHRSQTSDNRMKHTLLPVITHT